VEELIKRAGEIDVASLARELGISGVAVRQHLAALERDERVTQRTVRRPIGRPARLYRLTEAAEQAFPQTTDQVALDLLARLEKLLGPEAIDKVFRTRLRDLARQYGERLGSARSLTEKLEVLAEIRQSEGYLCSLEEAAPSAARGGVRLVEHHCPVSGLADQYPQMCDYELELFRRVLGEPQLCRVEHIRSGGHACRYQLPRRSRRRKS
jgi:predicted ArsR family transcriptional regulator